MILGNPLESPGNDWWNHHQQAKSAGDESDTFVRQELSEVTEPWLCHVFLGGFVLFLVPGLAGPFCSKYTIL